MKTEGITTSGNKWKEYGGRNEYGGSVHGIQFENPCTREDCDEVANTPGWCCYFGYGIESGNFGSKFVMLKIYND